SPAELPGGGPAGCRRRADGELAGEALRLPDGRAGDPGRDAAARRHGIRRGDPGLAVLRGREGPVHVRGRRRGAGPQGDRQKPPLRSFVRETRAAAAGVLPLVTNPRRRPLMGPAALRLVGVARALSLVFWV